MTPIAGAGPGTFTTSSSCLSLYFRKARMKCFHVETTELRFRFQQLSRILLSLFPDGTGPPSCNHDPPDDGVRTHGVFNTRNTISLRGLATTKREDLRHDRTTGGEIHSNCEAVPSGDVLELLCAHQGCWQNTISGR